ncbi:MAG: gliding motility protein GldL [Bacteroidetes bacterium]|jgi:methyl-accepting chemotaxis protein|nr:gliding motility protein GldL [Bacteroidota bacterium]
MSSNKKKGKLDPITFIYGFGAAVVLVGAMFKFLGWNFANEMFILGLSIEAIVFLISAFERQSEDEEYRWEQVFPQLTNENSDGTSADMGGYQSAMSQFASTLGELNKGLKDMTESVQQIRSEMQANASRSAEMQKSMQEFNQLMENYNQNMRSINEKYNQFLNSGK